MEKQHKAHTKLIQRFTCTLCGHSYDLPFKTFAGMNAQLACHECDSLAFGLVRREVIEQEVRSG